MKGIITWFLTNNDDNDRRLNKRKVKKMAGKILAAVLLLFGGGVSLYIAYRTVLGIMQPAVQKKPVQNAGQNFGPPSNNLQLQNQPLENQKAKKS